MYRSLTEYFEETGVLQQDLAELLGVSHSYVSMIVSGDRTPSLALAVTLSKATGVPVASFLPTRARRRRARVRQVGVRAAGAPVDLALAEAC